MSNGNNKDSKTLVYLFIFVGILLLASVCGGGGGGGGDYDPYDNARRALR